MTSIPPVRGQPAVTGTSDCRSAASREFAADLAEEYRDTPREFMAD